MMRRLLAFPLFVLFALAACHSGQTPPAQTSSSPDRPSAEFDQKIYPLRGKVVSTDAAQGEVTLNHEAIPGFMDAMTMPYKLKDPSILGELHPGDVITADVLVFEHPEGETLLDHIVVVAQAKPDTKPPVSYHVPTPGDAVPDFALRNQDGRVIHLGQFRGKSLVVTFIYTRCPAPEFCPRVTRNFAELEKQLAANPALYAKTHLLSISFDPQHDTPQRLRAYGESYMGSGGKNAFAHWEFGAPEASALVRMAQFFDLGISENSDSTITHTLSTTLIGPDGKVVRFYPGNEWTPKEVLSDLERKTANAG
jgi:protein SCO1/2